MEERDKLTEAELRHNRGILLAYFLYTTLNGALRKWVFSGSSLVENVLLLLQLLSPILMAVLMKRRKRVFFSFPILPFSLVLAVLALNPMNHTMFHGAFGFVLHVGFWLAMCIYLEEREAFPVERIVGAMLVVCIGEALLGFLQFGLPGDHILNRYVSNNHDVSGFGGEMGTRVVGTFSYIAGYGAFLVFFGMLVWALMVENRRRMPLIFAFVVIGLVSAFMNGGRAIVLPFLLTTVFGFISYGSVGNKVKGLAVLAVFGLLALVYEVGDKVTIVERSFNAFYSRVQYGNESGETAGRTFMTFKAVLDYGGRHPLFGAGLGATYQGAIAKWGRSPEISPRFEEEPERVIMEGGYFLFIIRLLMFVFVLTRLVVPVYFSGPFLFYLLMFSPLIFNTNQSTFAFFGLMLVDKMYFLKQREKGGSG